MAKTEASAGLSHQQGVWLDSVRAIAAIAVFVGHARGMFLVDGAEASLSVLGKAFYYLTGFGHQAVVIFFVLSGFLVGGSALRAEEAGRWSLTRYAAARVSRMYVVVVPALLLTALLDSLGAAWGGSNSFYTGQFWGAHLGSGYSWSQNFTLTAFIGNLLFLQTIAVPTFGTNVPLWSLANEAVYYALFPLLLLFQSRVARVAMCGLAASMLTVFLGMSFGDGFLFWVMGAGVAWLGIRFGRQTAGCAPWIVLPGLVLLGVALHAGRVGWAPERPGDVLIASAFLVNLASVVWSPCGGWLARVSLPEPVSRFLAGMSFSLYVVHFPVLVLISAMTLHAGRMQPTAAVMAVWWLGVFGVGCVCWLFSLLTEKNTDRIRGLLMTLIAASPRRSLKS